MYLGCQYLEEIKECKQEDYVKKLFIIANLFLKCFKIHFYFFKTTICYNLDRNFYFYWIVVIEFHKQNLRAEVVTAGIYSFILIHLKKSAEIVGCEIK